MMAAGWVLGGVLLGLAGGYLWLALYLTGWRR